MKSPISPAKSKDRFKVFAAVTLPILGLVYVHAAAHIMFYRIDLGMHESTVERIYGTPEKNEATMLFCERIFEWSGDCPQDTHGSYQFFKKGIDRWVVVGFDSEHRVAFKTIGSL